MKKITLILLLILSVMFSGNAQVLIGTGNTTTGQFTPFKPYWRYTYTQSIYLSSEINASGNITSIQWYFKGTSAIPNSDNITVYLGTTTKTSFASTSDWIPVTNMTKVFEGAIIMDSPLGDGWKTVTFTTPFAYDGTQNLVIATDENDPGTESPDLNQNFYNSAVTGNRSIYAVNGTTDIDPTTPPGANNLKAFVPNIIIGGIAPACETPQNLTISNVTNSTATVSWQNLGNTTPANGAEYYVSPSSIAPTASATPSGSVVFGTTANLTALQAGTTYFVWVRNNCTTEKSPWSPSATFTTVCPVSVSQFYENCDNNNTTVPNLPNCWTSILRANSGSLCPSAKVQTITGGNAYSPLNCIALNNCNSSGNYDIMLVSPKISNLDNSPNRLIFYSKGGIVEVGTLDKNTSDAVFTVFESYSTSTTSAYSKYTVEFSGYSGTDSYIGIRMKTTNPQQYSVYLDDISWSLNPTCPDVKQVNVAGVTSTTATIGWSESGGGETSWDITVGAPNVTDPSTLPYFNTTDSGTYTLTNLAPATPYKAWVRSVCGTGATDKGDWIGPVSFITDCATLASFVEDFNSVTVPFLPSCWNKILRANSGVLTAQAKIETTTYDVFNSTTSVTLSSGNSTGNFDVILVSPKLSTLATGDNYRLKFRSRFSNKTVEIGTLSSSTNTAVYTNFATVQFNATGAAAEYVVDFSSYSGIDEYIGIRMPNIEGQGFAGISLDNIIWEPVPLCPEVSKVAVPKVTETSATVEWTSTPIETNWDVVYGLVKDTDPNLLPIHTATSPTYLITGLEVGTSYNVWVRANCNDNGTGAWVGPVIFTTECLTIETFSENFDSQTVPNIPSCWSKILRGPMLSQYARIGTSSTYTPYTDFIDPKLSAPNHIEMVAQGSAVDSDLILVSPKVNNLNGKNRLKFDTYYPGRIQVGTLNGNTSAAVFTPLENSIYGNPAGYLLKTNVINNTYSTGDSPVVDITDYHGSDTYIGIRLVPDPDINSGTGFPSIFIDNVKWEPLPVCPEVTNITIPSTTLTSATIAWIAGGTETSWEIAYGATTVTDPNTLAPFISASTNPYTISGLTSGTSYNVWVRALCGGTLGNSAWVGPIVFTTQCTSTNVPYTQNFNTAIVPNLPNCTSESKTGFAGDWNTTEANIYGYDTQLLRYVGDFAEEANAWFYSQGINLTQGENYTISYEYGSNSNGPFTGNNLKVMYGNSNTADGMTIPLADYQFYYGYKTAASVDFTPPSTGVYYFGWNVYSPPGQGFVFLDNIVINSKLSTSDFDMSKFSFYPNPVKDVLNLSYINDITSVSVYNILGQEVIVKTLRNNNTKIDMSALSKGTYMVKVVSDNVTKTIKVIKE